MGTFNAYISVELIFVSFMWILLIIILFFFMPFKGLLTFNKVISIRLMCCGNHILLINILQVVNYVVSKTTIEKDWLLTNDTNLFSQIMNVVILDILAI